MQPELWRTIPDSPRYEASSLGRVRSAKTGRLRKPAETRASLILALPDREGRLTTRNVGALVLLAFVGPRPDGYDTSHLDGNFHNNAVENLAWESKKQNMARRSEHGTHYRPQGSAHASAKLTEAQVEAIHTRLAAGEQSRDLATEYKVSRTLISNIKCGRAWFHVGPQLVTEACRDCDGSGADWPEYPDDPCLTCWGVGEIEVQCA